MRSAPYRLPRRQRSLKALLATEPRCIYCANTRETARMTVEHMPPIAMFRDRLRLMGMEYATCQPCNNGTKGADVVASFMARVGQDISEDGWEIRENQRLVSGLDQSAPGVREELFNERTVRNVTVSTPGGVLVRKIQARANGPLLTAYMNVFAAKLAMAMYREKIGVALPMNGRIETLTFYNAGLAQKTAETMLEILPADGSLTQGKEHSIEQFAYRYNSDHQEIVAALVGFHRNLHIMILATSNPIYEGIESPAGTCKSRPGQLLEMLPKRRALILPGLPGWGSSR